MFNETSSPFELIRELQRVNKLRRKQDEHSELRGKHELSSSIIRPSTGQVNESGSSPFLLVGSPLYKKMKRNQKLQRSNTSKNNTLLNYAPSSFSKNMGLSNGFIVAQDNVRIEDNSQPQVAFHTKKRSWGCASAISVSTPKQAAFTQGHIAQNLSKEQIFEEVLKETRPERTIVKHQSTISFWDKFKKRCRYQVRKPSKCSTWK